MHIAIVEAYDVAFVNFRREFIRSLLLRGVKVTAIAPSFSRRVGEQLEQLGVDMKCVAFERGSINPFAELRAVSGLSTVLGRVEPDVVYSFGPKPVIYTGLASVRSSLTRVGVVTGLGYGFVSDSVGGRAVRTVQKSLYRRSLRRMNQVVFQNRDDLGEFIRLGIVPSDRPGVRIVNGSGVDLEEFAAVPPPESGVPSFLFVGRLQSSKGFDEFCEAARIVRNAGFSARFVVAGWFDEQNPDGISASRLERLVDEGVLEYLGRLDDVRPALESCDVFVLPSLREGTPRSVLEAMSVGRAVITTDAPGCRETVIDGWNGFLVPVRRADLIASAMLKYCIEPSLSVSHGLASRDYARRKFDVEAVNDRLFAAGGVPEKLNGQLGKPASRTSYRIERGYLPSDAPMLAGLHMEAFPEFFLSVLGPRFLQEFYLGFPGDDSSIIVVARAGDGRIVGVAVGSADPEGFFGRLLRRRFFGFAFAGLRSVVENPSVAGRLVRGLAYRGDSPKDAPGALLSSIAVSPELQGRGLGQRMLREWESAALDMGVSRAYLTTDLEMNDRTREFYEKLGWTLHSEYRTPQGRRMARYARDLGV